jgi:hypothetical protein
MWSKGVVVDVRRLLGYSRDAVTRRMVQVSENQGEDNLLRGKCYLGALQDDGAARDNGGREEPEK